MLVYWCTVHFRISVCLYIFFCYIPFTSPTETEKSRFNLSTNLDFTCWQRLVIASVFTRIKKEAQNKSKQKNIYKNKACNWPFFRYCLLWRPESSSCVFLKSKYLHTVEFLQTYMSTNPKYTSRKPTGIGI